MKKKWKKRAFSTQHLVHHLALFIKNNEQSNKQKDNDYSNIPKKRVHFLVLQDWKMDSLKTMIIIINNFFANSKNLFLKTKKWTPWKETKKLQFSDLQKWSKLMNKKMMNKVMRRKKTFTIRKLPSPWPPLDSPQPPLDSPQPSSQ